MTTSRDFITPVQRGRLPAFVRSDYPAFEKYIIDYFTWLEQDGNVLQILEEWYANNDPDNMVEPYVSAILRDLGWTWEGSLAIPKNLLLKNLRDFYLSRGTKKSFEFLFRALFDEPIAIKYPRERMLVLDQADYASESRVYTTANNRLGTTAAAILADLNGRKHVQMTGIVSGTVATIESIQILLSGDRAYFQITILEPLTDFVVKEDVRIESESGFIIERLHNVMTVTITDPGNGFALNEELAVSGAGLNGVIRVSNLKGGKADSVAIIAPGESYVVGDKILAEKIEGDYGFGFYAKVSGVGANGEITKINISDFGRGYRVVPPLYIKSPTGSGAKLQIVSGSIGAVNRIAILQPYVDFDPTTAAVELGNAAFEVGETTIFRSRAYKDRRGVLGENSILIDSDQYQQFSYDLVTALSSGVHRQIVDELLHPVGFIRTDVLKVDRDESLEVAASITTNVEQGTQTSLIASIGGDGIVTLDNDYIGTL
jgi:hypothetical protein